MKPKTMLTGALLAFVALSVGALIIKEARHSGSVADEQVHNAVTDSLQPSGDDSVAGPDVVAESNRTVVAYYFHGSVRCATCRKIEAYTDESIRTFFTHALSTGQLVWKAVNVDEPQNEHFITDYQLTTRSVVLADMKGDEQVAWKNLNRVWDLVRDKEKFQTYIVDETTSFLQKGNM